MTCVFCGGQVEDKEVTFVYDDDNYFFISHVPAEVCLPKVTDELIRLAKKEIAPTKIIQIPIFEYAGAMAR